jgi:hypothetical protein
LRSTSSSRSRATAISAGLSPSTRATINAVGSADHSGHGGLPRRAVSKVTIWPNVVLPHLAHFEVVRGDRR